MPGSTRRRNQEMSSDENEGTATRSNDDDSKRDFKAEHDAAAKAVIDNMARLRALRLAKEAAEPVRPSGAAKRTRAKPGKKSQDKAAAKTPALSDWLAGQQSGGHRT